MIRLLVLPTVFLTSLSTIHAGGPFDAIKADIGKLYQRYAACQKLSDEDRETTCLQGVERDAAAAYLGRANEFGARALNSPAPNHASLFKAMVGAQAVYVTNQCHLTRALAGPHEAAMRRTYARCVVRAQAEAAWSLSVLENGVLTSVGAEDYRGLSADVATTLKTLDQRTSTCSTVPVPAERDVCTAGVVADIKTFADPALARVRATLARKSGAAKLLPLHDAAQKAWGQYAAALCRTTADLRPNPSASTAFHDACVARTTMARVREAVRDL